MNTVTPQLHIAHFQLTGCCNLRCVFCGQSKGMLASDPECELSTSEWLRVAAELKSEAEQNQLIPEVTLWGGEPLLREDFSEIAETLHDQGFRLSVVTNGTLIDRHAAALNRCFAEIFISIDGEAITHNLVRGNGTFEAIERNIALLASRCGSLVFMTTVADANVATVAELPQRLSRFKPDSWIMGQLMYLSSEDIAEYDRIALQLGQVPYPELAVWRRDDDGEYLTRLKKAEAKITASQHPFPTKFTPHNYPDSRFSDHYCQAINHRLHIRHDGECGCCTDYFGIRLGNVKQKSLSEIFYGEPAQKLREYLSDHRLPTCNHCPWLPQRSYFSKIRI